MTQTRLRTVEASDVQASRARARMGFNHNVMWKGRLFHVQTEDAGREHGHVDTHVFFGGRIVASVRSAYDPGWSDMAERVTEMMRIKHRAMCVAVVSGRLGARIDAVLKGEDLYRRRTLAEVVPQDLPGELIELPAVDGPRDGGAMVRVMEVLAELHAEVAGFSGAGLISLTQKCILGSSEYGLALEEAVDGAIELCAAHDRVAERLGLRERAASLVSTTPEYFVCMHRVDLEHLLLVLVHRRLGNLALASEVIRDATRVCEVSLGPVGR